MALHLMEGFDRYGAIADLGLRFTIGSTPVYNSTGGRFGGGCVEVGDSTAELVDCILANAATMDGAGAKVHAAWHFKCTDLPAAASVFASLRTSADVGATLRVDASGNLTFRKYGNATDIATSFATIAADSTWHHIEIEARFAESPNGSCRIWLDGALVVNVSAVDTLDSGTPSAIDRLRLVGQSSMMFHHDDVVVWDETGTDFVVTQLDEHKIETLSVQADDSVQFTPSASTNNTNVDDAAFHDTDTTYNESSTVGHVDLFTLVDQAATPVTAHAVGVNIRARKTTADPTVARSRIDIGGTVVESGDFTLTTSYAHYAAYFGKEPDTSAWDATDIDSLKVGYEYQS